MLVAGVALLTALAVVVTGSLAAVRVAQPPGGDRAAGDAVVVAALVLLVAAAVVLVVRGLGRRLSSGDGGGVTRPAGASRDGGPRPAGGPARPTRERGPVAALRVTAGTVPGLDGRWRRGRVDPSPGYLRVLPVRGAALRGHGHPVTTDVVAVRPTGRTTSGSPTRGVPPGLGVLEVHTFDGVLDLAVPVADLPGLVEALQP
ncbi:hypothetical protein Cma02nite_17780 [Cellulomonas marina]|uniref:Uncharacterized protein n=1 Tax=Cellulomonas marina TaxID=988821 RepID=A0A1I0VAY3_9CELL|nr:hypothetical protein Cma02nite_17780 [Cellulomonas marina]SFA73402.1 hypothetical protein SAMN05421867_101281 [Cellulomonas marina]